MAEEKRVETPLEKFQREKAEEDQREGYGDGAEAHHDKIAAAELARRETEALGKAADELVKGRRVQQGQAEHLALTVDTKVLAGLVELGERHPRSKKIIEQCLSSGEPFIVFRAKDIFTPMVISHYISLLEQTFGHHHNLEQQEALVQHRGEVVDWQRAHAERVRYPD